MMAPVVLSLGGGNMVDKYLINGSVVIDVFGGKEDDAVCVLAGRIPVGPPESHNGAEKGHLFIQPLPPAWVSPVQVGWFHSGLWLWIHSFLPYSALFHYCNYSDW